MQMVMENSGVAANGKPTLSADRYLLPSCSFKGSEEDSGGESAFYEKFLLDDLDSYWDDLNARLTVSRMVNDSIIKGMVNAVVEEAADGIASKEAEIAILNERLRSYQSGSAENNNFESSAVMPKPSATKVETQNVRSLSLQSCSDANTGFCYTKHFASLNNAVEEVRRADSLMEVDKKVDGLKALLVVVFEQIDSMFCLAKTSACEQQFEHDIQREVTAIVTHNSIRALHDEFETKLYEQRRFIRTLSMDWQTRIEDLSNISEELDSISRSFSLEPPGSLLSYNSIESFGERNATKGKDRFARNHHISGALQPEENGSSLLEKSMDSPKPMLEDADSPKLKHMTKDEVITYYKTEMLKMSRQQEQALQENTEELFRLKREFLKEKGSSHLRKDKDIDIYRKRIPEVIKKLDDILLMKKKLPLVNDDHDELCNLKNRIDTLLLENQHLRGLLTDKRKEVKNLSSQVSDASSQMLLHSSTEAAFLKRINKLKWDVEDLKIEAKIRDDVYSSLLKELSSEYKCGIEDIHSQSQIMQEIHFLIFKGVVHSAMLTVNPMVSKYHMEKVALETVLSEKERVLCLALEENKKLKQDVVSLSISMKEKEKYVSDAGVTLVQQQEHFGLTNRELVMLRDQVGKQEALIADKNTELVSLKSTLNETLQQIQQQHEVEMNELNQKLKIASESLKEAENQKTILRGIEKQKSVSSSITKDKEQAKQMKSIVINLIEDLENRLTENIKINESRLEVLNHQCVLLTQQASLLWKMELWYKQIIEIKSSNLQKAEAEVDLLGDEVDTLMSLLGKIYIVLDHYSPIFELYPSVMDILKLVQRKLEEETIILV